MKFLKLFFEIENEDEVKEFWQKKVRPFLPNDEIEWSDLSFVEKRKIARMSKPYKHGKEF